MTVASGTSARIGRQHAVDVGPDHDLRGIEQRAEDRRRVVAAVAAERGLQALRVDGDEAGDDDRALESGRDRRRKVGARSLPAHARPEGSPFNEQHAARIEPQGRRGSGPAGAQQPREDARGPELPETCDKVAHGRRGRPHHVNRLQDAADVAAIGIQLDDEFVAGVGRQQLARELHVARPKLLEPRLDRLVLPLGKSDQVEQRVGDAPAGRQHHGLAARGIRLDDRGDAPHADGIGDTRAAELVDSPGFQTPVSLLGRARRHGGPSGNGPDRELAGTCRWQCDSL